MSPLSIPTLVFSCYGYKLICFALDSLTISIFSVTVAIWVLRCEYILKTNLPSSVYISYRFFTVYFKLQICLYLRTNFLPVHKAQHTEWYFYLGQCGDKISRSLSYHIKKQNHWKTIKKCNNIQRIPFKITKFCSKRFLVFWSVFIAL